VIDIAAHSRPTQLLAATAAAAVLAVGCGDSSDSQGPTAQGTASATGGVDGGPGITGDAGGVEGEIASVYRRLADTAYDKDYKTSCELMSAAARKAMSRGGRPCPAALRAIYSTGNVSTKRPYIAKLDIRGDRAIARVKVRGSDTYPVPFVKENGTWKADVRP